MDLFTSVYSLKEAIEVFSFQQELITVIDVLKQAASAVAEVLAPGRYGFITIFFSEFNEDFLLLFHMRSIILGVYEIAINLIIQY